MAYEKAPLPRRLQIILSATQHRAYRRKRTGNTIWIYIVLTQTNPVASTTHTARWWPREMHSQEYRFRDEYGNYSPSPASVEQSSQVLWSSSASNFPESTRWHSIQAPSFNKPGTRHAIAYSPHSALDSRRSFLPYLPSTPWTHLVVATYCCLRFQIWRGVSSQQDAVSCFQMGPVLGYLWLRSSSFFSVLSMAPVSSISKFPAVNYRLTWLGIGPIPSIYFSEAFPLSHRELGAAFTICVNNIVGSALSLSFPSILAKMTATGGTYWPESQSKKKHNWQLGSFSIRILRWAEYARVCSYLFHSARNNVSWAHEKYIFSYLTANRKRTLEELDYTFGVPIHRHARYQVGTWLPWFVKRYVFFQRSAKLEPLYKLEGFWNLYLTKFVSIIIV